MSLSCHHVSFSRLALIWSQLALLIVIGSCLPLVVHGSQDASLSSSSLIRRPNNNKKSDTDIHVVKKQEDEAHTDMLLSGDDERSIVDGINQHHSDNSLGHANDHNGQSKDDLFFFQKEMETMARQLQGDFNGSSSEGLGMDMVPGADANITFNVGGIMIEQATAEALCPLEWTLTIICVASTCIDFMDTCPPSTISKQSMPETFPDCGTYTSSLCESLSSEGCCLVYCSEVFDPLVRCYLEATKGETILECSGPEIMCEGYGDNTAGQDDGSAPFSGFLSDTGNTTTPGGEDLDLGALLDILNATGDGLGDLGALLDIFNTNSSGADGLDLGSLFNGFGDNTTADGGGPDLGNIVNTFLGDNATNGGGPLGAVVGIFGAGNTNASFSPMDLLDHFNLESLLGVPSTLAWEACPDQWTGVVGCAVGDCPNVIETCLPGATGFFGDTDAPGEPSCGFLQSSLCGALGGGGCCMLNCFDQFFDAVTCVLKNNTLPDTSNITDGTPVDGILAVADDCKPIPCESSNMTGALESAGTSTDATTPPTEAATNTPTNATDDQANSAASSPFGAIPSTLVSGLLLLHLVEWLIHSI